MFCISSWYFAYKQYIRYVLSKTHIAISRDTCIPYVLLKLFDILCNSRCICLRRRNFQGKFKMHVCFVPSANLIVRNNFLHLFILRLAICICERVRCNDDRAVNNLLESTGSDRSIDSEPSISLCSINSNAIEEIGRNLMSPSSSFAR